MLSLEDVVLVGCIEFFKGDFYCLVVIYLDGCVVIFYFDEGFGDDFLIYGIYLLVGYLCLYEGFLIFEFFCVGVNFCVVLWS